MFEWIAPDWQAPARVKALVTLAGGHCDSSYGAFNTADHVGDDPKRVANHRTQFFSAMNLPANARWISQVHGTECLQASLGSPPSEADAVWTDQFNTPCLIHTADCLPVFFCNRDGTKVALAHAGWRGMLAGVLENTLLQFSEPGQVIAWLGPAIGPASFQVGEDVYNGFLGRNNAFEAAFKPEAVTNASEQATWQCDLYLLATYILAEQGVTSIAGGGFDTFTDTRFFSYRRNTVCGRMLSAIWIDPAQ